MAQGRNSIETRITLTGAEEVRRHFEQMGKAGEGAGNQIRRTLQAATSGAAQFSAGTQGARNSSGQLRFALQNLTFQVNDVATSLASGGDVMRVFAQQGGQVFQAFQQGGGARVVFGGIASAVGSMITPMRLTGVAAVALAGGFALIAARAASAQDSARQFDVVLQGIGKSSQATGKEMVEASRRLREVGLSTAEAEAAQFKALREGVRPADVERVVQIGKDLNAVLGEGSMEQFISAAAQGGEPLRQFAVRLGIIPKEAAAVSTELQKAGDAVSKTSRSIDDALQNRARSLADEERNSADQIAELTRKKGSAREEIERASSRRVVEINRQSNRAIADLIEQRNRENAQKLAEHNQQIEAAAQKALESSSLIDQIGRQVGGRFRQSLGPLRETILELSLAWNRMLDALADSAVFQAIVSGVQQAVRALGSLFDLAARFPNVTAAFFGIAGAVVTLGAGIIALRLAFSGLGAVIAPVSTGLLTIAAAVGWPALLLAGLVAVTAAFVDWQAVLDGTTWRQFVGYIKAGLQLLLAIGEYIGRGILSAFEAVAGFVKAYIIDPIVNGFYTAIYWVNYFIGLVRGAIGDLGKLFGLASGGSVGEAVQGAAGGGLMRGPGGPTGDKILIRASAGEYMVRAAAVSHYGVDAMHALNAMAVPRFSWGGFVTDLGDRMAAAVSPMRFADGGLVTASAGGPGAGAVNVGFAPVNLSLDGRVVAQSVLRVAGGQSLRSLGRKPAAYGSR